MDLESPSKLSVFSRTGTRPKIAVANLQGVQVYLLGVDGADRQIAYWQGLRSFWQSYFQKAGAALGGYSVLRELPVAGP
jgi:hypothetical protein